MQFASRAIVVTAGMFAIAAAVLFGTSEWLIRRSHAAPYPAIVADRSTAGIAEGARLSKIEFCQGCHGEHGEGGTVDDDPAITVYAPGFARLAATWSDAELARALRSGVTRDGRAMFVMPVRLVGRLSDGDIAAILGWMRTLRPGPDDVDRAGVVWTPHARFALLTGALAPAAAAPPAPHVRPTDAGGYFVESACVQCHRLHRDNPLGEQVAPALAPVGAAYDPAAFRRLLRTGRGMTPGDLGWMGYASKQHLRYLSDPEIAQVQAYLRRAAAHPPQ